jgi:probable rRNA maturation factor
VTMVDLLVRPEAAALVSPAVGRALAARLRAALRLLHRSRSRVTLLLTVDAEIRALNRRYRKLDRATDVLSFHQQELRGEADPAGGGIFLGDIVISVETALRRASGRRLSGELARIAMHGLCHIFGHDHVRPAQATAMRRVEDRLLRGTRD